MSKTESTGKHRLTPDEACALAESHAQRGNVGEAEKILQMAIRAAPSHSRSLHQYGLLKFKQGQGEEALDMLRRAVTLAPGEVQYHSNLGVAFQRLDRLYEAEAAYRRALELNPDAASGHFNLGLALQKQERYAESETAYRRAVELDPDYADAWNNLGAVLQLEKKFTEAHQAYRRALALVPEDSEAYNNLGSVLEALDRDEEAETAFRRALEINPDYPKALNNLGSLLRHSGRTTEAEAACRRALELSPDYLEAYYNLAHAHRFQPRDPLLTELKQQLARQPRDGRGRAHLLVALGKAHDDLGSYDQAFGYYREANKEIAGRVSFDAAGQREQTETIRSAFSQPLLCQDVTPDDKVPIFVIGMSRAGKTLVESLLAQHPHVIGAGERREWSEALDRVCEKYGIADPFPDCVESLTPAQIREVGERYLEELGRQLPGGRAYVNTMPGHYRHLGLMFRAFPSVKVIYCQRDPLDHCLSVYFSIYAHGNDYAYDLQDVAAYYQSYRGMMAHWLRLYGERILTVQYETLVRAPLQVAEAVYGHCGLDFEPGMIRADFKTDQIGRARPYETHLAPLRAALGHFQP